MKYYHYFVSCSFSDDHMGMVEFLSSHILDSFDDILRVRDFIARESDRMPGDVSIIYYKLIRDEPY